MGHIRHRVVIATVPLYLGLPAARRKRSAISGHDIPELLERFCDEMPARLRHLLAGPILSDVNGVHTWFFATAASKGGWEEDNEVFAWQEQFIAIFDRPQAYQEDGGHLCSVIVLQWPECAVLGQPTTVRRLQAPQTDAMPVRRHRQADFDIGDLVSVREDDVTTWLGKVAEAVPGDVGGWTYRVRVTSRIQQQPACGEIVTVPRGRMSIRHRQWIGM